jgi:hypothetical protein
MSKLPVILAVVFFAFSAARVEAESFVLVDLIADDGSVVQGDKLFDNFGIQVLSEFGFGFPFIDNVGVEGITRNGEHGLRFVGTWRAQGQLEGASGFEIVLTYRVTSLDPEFLINDVTIASSVSVRDGAVVLTEQATAPNGDVLASASANAVGTFPVDPSVMEISDHQVLSEDVSSMDVQAGIAQMRTYVNLDVNGFSWPGPAPVAADGSVPDCTIRPDHSANAAFFCPDPLIVSAGPDGPVGDNLLGLGHDIQTQVAVGWPDSYFLYEGVGGGQVNGYAGVNAQSDHTSFIAAGVPSFFLFNGDALNTPIGIHNQRDTIENWTKYMVHNFQVDLESELEPADVEFGEALIAKTFETYLWMTFYIFLKVELGEFQPATG